MGKVPQESIFSKQHVEMPTRYINMCSTPLSTRECKANHSDIAPHTFSVAALKTSSDNEF